MNVSELQEFLRGLCDALPPVGASRAAQELDRIRQGLNPFRDLTIPQLADFLGRAEEYARTGVIPTKGKGRSTKAKGDDPAAIALAVEEMRSLYERAASPEVGYATIDAEVKKTGTKFTKPGVNAIANGFGLAGTFKTKKAALDEIQRKITERKESHQRTQF